MVDQKGSAQVVRAGQQPSLHVLYEDAFHCTAMYQDLQLCVSRGEPSLEFLHQAVALIQQQVGHWPDGMGLLIVISADAPPPGEATRRYMSKAYPAVSKHLRGIARVIEGEGFVAAAKRSAISFIDLAMRLHCPSKVTGNVDDGAAWLLRQMGAAEHRQYSVTDVALAVLRLRERQAASLARLPAAR
jgi:hypothetical protein